MTEWRDMSRLRMAAMTLDVEQSRKAANSIHMGPEHQSRITLPVTKIYRA